MSQRHVHGCILFTCVNYVSVDVFSSQMCTMFEGCIHVTNAYHVSMDAFMSQM